MASTMIVQWYATGFRGDAFEEALNDAASIAMRYGANSFAVYRSREDRYKFQQLADFDNYLDWERYWESTEMVRFRAQTMGWYQVPIQYGDVGPHGARRGPRAARGRGRRRQRLARAALSALLERGHRQPRALEQLPVVLGELAVAAEDDRQAAVVDLVRELVAAVERDSRDVAASTRATWSNVLWLSLRTITRQLPPSPQPGPCWIGLSIADDIAREDKAGRATVQCRHGHRPLSPRREQRDRPWMMRTYAGHSTAKASNELYRRNLEKGQTGLSVAFDLPTQTGYDAGDELARGEVGKVGVPIAHRGDMETLMAGIPLGEMNTSMTINATAAWLLALYIVAAESQGVEESVLQGTTQNDIIKEFLARGTYAFPPGPVDAADRGHDRLHRRARPEVEPDQHLLVPPPGGRRDAGPGDRLLDEQRDRGARRRARTRRRRS